MGDYIRVGGFKIHLDRIIRKKMTKINLNFVHLFKSKVINI